jgi:hypothetical protein
MFKYILDCSLYLQKVGPQKMKISGGYRPDVIRLDTGGITLEGRALGQTLLWLEHTFTSTPLGTRYETRMRVGLSSAFLRPISRPLLRRRFSDAKAESWLKHNIEEVGNLSHFLPKLYVNETVATR